MSRELFLIDSNSLITPHQQYYPFDFAPGFWTQMETRIKDGSIILLDMVKDELRRGSETDSLKAWIEALDVDVIDRRELAIIKKYGEVLDYLQVNPCYKQSALDEWAKETVADAWLIASAAVHGYTLVTFEPHNGNLNQRFPSKEAKIPDVADAFNVKTKSLFYMMRSLNFKL